MNLSTVGVVRGGPIGRNDHGVKSLDDRKFKVI